jgi:diacylglycerol kinase (ATP)
MNSNGALGRAGFARIVRATGYSWQGIRSAYRGEAAFRQEAWIALVLIPLSFVVGRGWVEIALLAGSVVLVLIVELLNSSVEAAIDRISLDLHDLSKQAKDRASAAVMLSLLLCAAIWLGALWQRWATG